MRRSTHKELGNRILDELELSDAPSAHAFRVAVAAPDTWREEKPHHFGREEDIRELIIEARRLKLKGDEKGCMRNLGYALHYVQDHWTHAPGRGPRHHAYERDVDEAPPQDPADLSGVSEEAKAAYVEVEALLQTTEGREATLSLATKTPREGNPTLDRSYAYRVSLRVARSVLTDETPRETREAEQRIRLEAATEEEAVNAALEKEQPPRGGILGLPGYIRGLLRRRRLEATRSRIRIRCADQIKAAYAPHKGWYAPAEPVNI